MNLNTPSATTATGKVLGMAGYAGAVTIAARPLLIIVAGGTFSLSELAAAEYMNGLGNNVL